MHRHHFPDPIHLLPPPRVFINLPLPHSLATGVSGLVPPCPDADAAGAHHMRMCCAVALPPHMIPVCAIIPASSFFPGEKGGEQRVVRLVSLQLFQVAMPVLLLL